MKSLLIFVAGGIAGVLVCVIVPLVVMASGIVDVGADVHPGFIERTLAPWALDQSVERRAPRETDPYANEPAAVVAGLESYRDQCVICHGAPAVEAADLSKGLNPDPPSLANESDVTDGEIFWIIKHGIRMTGMAAFGLTHNDERIWKLVAFVRHLPDLTVQERESLQKGNALIRPAQAKNPG